MGKTVFYGMVQFAARIHLSAALAVTIPSRTVNVMRLGVPNMYRMGFVIYLKLVLDFTLQVPDTVNPGVFWPWSRAIIMNYVLVI